MNSFQIHNYDENSINYKYASREEIIKWIYELNSDDKIIAFSITNVKLCELIKKMYYNYTNKRKFKLTFDNDDYNIESLKKFENRIENNLIIQEEKMAQQLFLKEIRFYSIKEENDTITLNVDCFSNKFLFVYYLDLFSKNKFFSTMTKVEFEPKQQIFKCKYPSWFKIKDFYSLPEIIVAHFEIILNINYYLYNKKNNSQNELYEDFFEKKKIIKTYLDSLSKDSESIEKILDLNNLIKETIEKKKSQVKDTNKYFFNNNDSPIKSLEKKEVNLEVLLEKYMKRLGEDRDDKIIDEFSFCSFSDLDSYEFEIEQRILKELYKLGYEKYLNDFIDEFNQENENNNKKKNNGKKKKKKSKKEKLIEEEKKEEPKDLNNNNNDNKNENIINIEKKNIIEEIKLKEKEIIEEKNNKEKISEDIIEKNEDKKIEENKEILLKNEKKKIAIKEYKLTQKEIKKIKANFFNNNNFKSINIKPIQNPKKLEKLHNLIITSITQMTNSLISIKELKYNNILYLCQKIKECFQCEISIEIYGSYSTGMEIESSDIDISINLINEEKIKNSSKEKLINDLNNFLSYDSKFENLIPITSTSVPILKLVINQYNIKTKVDLTFDLENTKNIINYYTNIIKKNPEIKPLTLIIKKLIHKNHLNKVFEGGLSSHSIFIMVASNIKLLKSNNNYNNNKLNLGELLLDLLRFYGFVFNYTNTIIDITNNNPYIITHELSKVPIFIDPISSINISKSSYQFDKIKELFFNTYTMLVQNENDIESIFEKQFGKI